MFMFMRGLAYTLRFVLTKEARVLISSLCYSWARNFLMDPS